MINSNCYIHLPCYQTRIHNVYGQKTIAYSTKSGAIIEQNILFSERLNPIFFYYCN
jgi:hypothetical protein